MKILFYKMFHIFSKEFQIDFQKKRWNYLNRKWNYFSSFQASVKKTYFTTSYPYLPRNSKLIFKTGNVLSKQEMELFLPLPGLWWKNFFYKMFLICTDKLLQLKYKPRLPLSPVSRNPCYISTKVALVLKPLFRQLPSALRVSGVTPLSL